MRRFTTFSGTLSAGEDKKQDKTAWPNLQLYRTHGDGMDADVHQSSQAPALEAEPCGSQKQLPESHVET